MSHDLSQAPLDRFAAANGIEVVEAGLGYARARMVAEERHLNSVGLVHGGALFTLAAAAFFAACNAAGKLAVGIHMNLECLQPGRLGELRAEAREEARSRRIATCSVRVTDGAGDLVAMFQGTAYVKDEPFPPKREG
jgi:acyl-CoA thioesterase